MMQFLYTNEATLPTSKGGGHNVHIVIIMKPDLYTTLSTMVWMKTTVHGVYPMVPTNATIEHQ